MKFTKFLLLAIVLTALGAPGARAEVFQWGDPEVNLSITFPDTWRRTSGQQPDDVITIVAPGSDKATCRLRVREDRRFVIYPRKYAGAIQRLNYSRDFWETYAGELGVARINRTSDNASLGKSFSSWADVSFVSAAEPGLQKRALVYAGVYNDNAYIFECTATEQAYGKWHNAFSSLLKSVDMRPEYTQNVNGRYRAFQNDADLRIHGMREVDLFIY